MATLFNYQFNVLDPHPPQDPLAFDFNNEIWLQKCFKWLPKPIWICPIISQFTVASFVSFNAVLARAQMDTPIGLCAARLNRAQIKKNLILFRIRIGI